MRKFINLSLLISSIILCSCEKFLEPRVDNNVSEDVIIANGARTEGLLLYAYSNMPVDYTFDTDVASDDAATNNQTSSYKRMGTGEWKSSDDPITKWTTAYQQIVSINKFLDLNNLTRYTSNPMMGDSVNDMKDRLFKKRLKGEAYGLRAYYKWQLLQYHSGATADGRLLGFPVIDKTISIADNWKLPRNTFKDCVTSIFNDLDTAIANLPATWVNGTDANINAAIGARYENRINGNTAKALKARVALLAASPAFSSADVVTWEQAATIAGDLLKTLPALYNNGVVFYNEIRNNEIIWNRAQRSVNSLEALNFPPSLYGSGEANPSQNLVDAFPMKNGYPITNALSTYDAGNPYSNRDPRLSKYIIHNTLTFKSTPIYTYIGAPDNGINVLPKSTITGYYLRKFMNEVLRLNPGSATTANHTYTIVRMTEVLLNFAEAANEAWGPDGDPKGYGFTAKSRIAELRVRAGLTPDAYLASITDKAGLRNLIRNERRLELCFEGFRFWDIRRWNDVALMQTPVQGAYITKVGSNYTYEYKDVEQRVYTQDMIYGPIPYNETLKYNIDQNKGW